MPEAFVDELAWCPDRFGLPPGRVRGRLRLVRTEADGDDEGGIAAAVAEAVPAQARLRGLTRVDRRPRHGPATTRLRRHLGQLLNPSRVALALTFSRDAAGAERRRGLDAARERAARPRRRPRPRCPDRQDRRALDGNTGRPRRECRVRLRSPELLSRRLDSGQRPDSGWTVTRSASRWLPAGQGSRPSRPPGRPRSRRRREGERLGRAVAVEAYGRRPRRAIRRICLGSRCLA